MNKKLIRHLALASASGLIMASASAQVTTDVLRDFSACDASFFRSLARTIPAAETPSTIARRGDIAWFKVRNRKEEADNHISFTPPLTVAGLKLLSYFDDASDLDEFARFYNWGFIAEGSLNQVMTALKPFIRDAARLRREDNMYARSELKIGKSPWKAVNLSSGSVPLPTTVERVLILEPVDDTNAVRVTCSLQGTVTGDLLKEERPDIDAADYPSPPVKPAAADTNLRPEVLSAVDAAAPAGSVWRPRFRKVVHTAERRGDKNPFEITEEIEARDGLLYTKEIYSPNFNVDRVSLAGLIQLRAKINGRMITSVNMTTGLKVSLPQKPAQGEVLSVNLETLRVPLTSGDEPKESHFSCTGAGSIQASTIFPTLTGTATLFSCQYPESGDKREIALIEDLGLTVETKSESEQYGKKLVRYTRFDVTK